MSNYGIMRKSITAVGWVSGSMIILGLSSLIANSPQRIQPDSVIGSIVKMMLKLGDWLMPPLIPRIALLGLVIGGLAVILLAYGILRKRQNLIALATLILGCSVALIGHGWLKFGSPTNLKPALMIAGALVIGIGAATSSWPKRESEPGIKSVVGYGLAVFLILMIGWMARVFVLDSVPFGIAGHAAYHSVEADRIHQQILAGEYLQSGGLAKGYYQFTFGFGQSVQRLIDMLSFSLWGFGFLQQRIMAGVIGLWTVALLYHWGARLYNRRVGIVAAFLLAVSPWHITWSRYEGSMQIQSLPYLIICLLLVSWSLERGRGYWFLVTGLWAGLTFLLYAPCFTVPMIVILYLGYLWATKQTVNAYRVKWYWMIWFIGGVGIMAIQRIRYTGLKLELILDTPLEGAAPLTVSLFLSNLQLFFEQFFIHPRGMHILRMGPILGAFISAIFVIGLGMMIRRIKRPESVLLLLVIIFGILPAITSETAYPRRFFNMIPAIYLIAAAALVFCWDTVRSLRLKAVTGITSVTAAMITIGVIAGSYWMYFRTISAPENEYGVLPRIGAESICESYYGKSKIYSLGIALNVAHVQMLCHHRIASEEEFHQWVQLVTPDKLLPLLKDPTLGSDKPVLICCERDNHARTLLETVTEYRYPGTVRETWPNKPIMGQQLLGLAVTSEMKAVAALKPRGIAAAFDPGSQLLDLTWEVDSTQPFTEGLITLGSPSENRPQVFEAETLSIVGGSGDPWQLSTIIQGFSGNGGLVWDRPTPSEIVVSFDVNTTQEASVWLRTVQIGNTESTIQIDDGTPYPVRTQPGHYAWRYLGTDVVPLAAGSHTLRFRVDGWTLLDQIVINPATVDPPDNISLLHDFPPWLTVSTTSWVAVEAGNLRTVLPSPDLNPSDLSVKIRLRRGSLTTDWSDPAPLQASGEAAFR